MKEKALIALLGLAVGMAGMYFYMHSQLPKETAPALDFEIRHSSIPTQESKLTITSGKTTITIADEKIKKEIAQLLDSKTIVLNKLNKDSDRFASSGMFGIESTTGSVIQSYHVEEDEIAYGVSLKKDGEYARVNSLYLKSNKKTREHLMKIFDQELEKQTVKEGKALSK